GNLLWSKSLGGGNAKAFRYSDCYLDNVPPPIPSITESGNMLSATLASSYQWYLNGQLLNGETGQSLNALQSGIYVVRTTDANGCVFQYSSGFNYQLSTSTDHSVDEKIFSVYPNPTTGVVNIKDGSRFGYNFEVEVFDFSGRCVLRNRNIYSIDLREYGPGSYAVRILPVGGMDVTFKICVAD
ncbi:MAG: T9SS type A sorting domain-containing protein, partial [Bacteroidota bacterium]